jgi:hypothetical protein
VTTSKDQATAVGKRGPVAATAGASGGSARHTGDGVTRVMASDRRGLWRLCTYGARGAVASSRLTELPDGRFA